MNLTLVRRILSIVLMIYCVAYAPAQKYSHAITGMLKDEFTDEQLPHANIVVMNPDSTVIASTVSANDTLSQHRWDGYFQVQLPEKGKYIVRITSLGYQTVYKDIWFKLRRQAQIDLGTIYLRKESVILEDVVVKATKIKMVVRGDTIIYNADAFQLAEGSMLDALIQQLPGTRLDNDGRIFANGRYVESLLVNGRDFFNGSPQLALQNLPAYTVKKVKLYDKAGNVSILADKDMGDKKYVMDVLLKKEYSKGYMGNFVTGAGTSKRYVLKGMLMQMSERSQLAAIGNVNNLNQKDQGIDFKERALSETPEGRFTTKEAALTYSLFKGKGQPLPILSNNTLLRFTDNNEHTSTSTQTFLNSGDTYSRSKLLLRQKNALFNTSNYLSFAQKNWRWTNGLQFRLLDKQTSSRNLSASFDIKPPSVEGLLDSILLDHSRYHDNTLNILDQNDNQTEKRKEIHASSIMVVKLINDLIVINALFDYENDRNKDFSQYDLTYFRGANPLENRNTYLIHPDIKRDIKLQGYYNYMWRNNWIRPFYNFKHTRHSINNGLYRLDKLKEYDGQFIHKLPSSLADLEYVRDLSNSYHFTLNGIEQEGGAELHFGMIKGLGWTTDLDIRIPFRYYNNRIDYFREIGNVVHKKKVLFEPSLRLDLSKWKDNVTTRSIIEFEIQSELPDMVDLVDFRDDSRPLQVRLGNPKLHNIHTKKLELSYSVQAPTKQRNWSVNLWWNHINNAIAYSLLFDKESGGSTIQPVNINGNWRTGARYNVSTPLDKKRKVEMTNDLEVRYNHYVDMIRESSEVSSHKSIIKNISLTENLHLKYQLNTHIKLGTKFIGRYSHVNGSLSNFENISTSDFGYGADVLIQLPWKMQMMTDVTNYCHRGYSDKSMNYNELVWNVRLSKSILKNRLTFTLDGFDLLGNLKNKRFIINSQGRTEILTNVMPRYVLLQATYRFNYNPSKHK